MIVEPVQGEGGYVVPHPGFLTRLRELTREHGILLIADEVQCGMGRTGRFFASEHFGLEPDIVTLAKGIASGMPLGALIARDEVMQWNDGGHGSTFGGNPVSVAAALATLPPARGRARRQRRAGGRPPARASCGRGSARHAVVGDIRGLGLMIGVEIVQDRDPRAAGSGAARADPRGGLPPRPAAAGLRQEHDPPRAAAHHRPRGRGDRGRDPRRRHRRRAGAELELGVRPVRGCRAVGRGPTV